MTSISICRYEQFLMTRLNYSFLSTPVLFDGVVSVTLHPGLQVITTSDINPNRHNALFKRYNNAYATGYV